MLLAMENIMMQPANTSNLDLSEKVEMRRKPRTRRGKKKIKKAVEENVFGPYDRPVEWSFEMSKEDLDLAKRKRILRPFYSPRAPHNSTQFLMEDHFQFPLSNVGCCTDYDSEESSSPNRSPVSYNWKLSPALNDIDYEYKSVEGARDDNMLSFFERDFDEVYKSAQHEELGTRSRDDLIQNILSLENRSQELKKEVDVLTSNNNQVQNSIVQAVHTCLPNSDVVLEGSSRTASSLVARLQAELLQLRADNELLQQQSLSNTCSTEQMDEDSS